jgi:alanyl aminopeptidase
LLFASGIGDLLQELNSVLQTAHVDEPGLLRQTTATVANLSEVVPDNLMPNYAQLIRSLYGAKANALGWRQSSTDGLETRLLRAEILPLVATRGEDAQLQNEAAKLARRWLQDRSGIDPDMVTSILTAAAWTGDQAYFDALVHAIQHDDIQRERAWMIASLRAFHRPELAQAALNLVFTPDIDARELQAFLVNPIPENREILWRFVQQNFERLNSTLPGARGIPFASTLPIAAAGFCDTTHRNEVAAFFEPRVQTLQGAARNLANTLERIEMCAARAEVVKPAVREVLRQYEPLSNR